MRLCLRRLLQVWVSGPRHGRLFAVLSADTGLLVAVKLFITLTYGSELHFQRLTKKVAKYVCAFENHMGF